MFALFLHLNLINKNQTKKKHVNKALINKFDMND